MKKQYSINEIAQILNISTNKLRFYEKKGLINPVRDDTNNYRYYTEENLVKIQTILMYRTLNLTIKDIQNLMKNCTKNNTINHFYNQWEVINDEMQRMRLIKTCLEETMDLIYESDEYNFLNSIIKSVKKLNDIQKIKNNWKDRWNFDSWAKTYDESIKENKGKLKIYKNYEKILDEVFKKAIENTKNDMKLLEIGVGTGNLAKRFLEKGYNIIGVDQSREMLNIAKEKFPKLKLRLGEFLKLPFENNAFDCIVSSYALHHLNDEEKKIAIKEMLRVLKLDGKIIIGDLMFENKKNKKEILDSFTQEQIVEVEDEYYSNIDFLKEEFKKHGKKINYTRIDQLNYVVKFY
ncbi:MerR family transcriptional regulator [Tepidibacter formicigenes]|jgi:putative AdoMet-dependent methyltransferase|uniref:Putative AdoMet-dependent methyltransferase n=1 Tax=Tepidibacter formicigenes DSM 15518 TaxID=1123349 RepID=A0A1M6LIW9_9FIRM|nr:MerR family transcriptional regulator [Tepidibacter formicigenes]SHJ71127.1 putative AdoMet-dependent methyltransferase [Tepidibacter formicigenes DSM 15518]